MKKLTGLLVLVILLCGCEERLRRHQQKVDALSEEDYQLYRECVTVAQGGEYDCLYRVQLYPQRSPQGKPDPSRAGTGGDRP